jgi:hypothetical protein
MHRELDQRNESTFSPAYKIVDFIPGPTSSRPGRRSTAAGDLPSPTAPSIVGCSGNQSTAQLRRDREVKRRIAILTRFLELRRAGLSNVRAAKKAGTSATTVWRWKNRGVQPRTGSCGRKAIINQIAIPGVVVKKIQRLQLSGLGNTTAWRALAKDRACPPALRKYLRRARTSVAPSLLALTRLTRARIEVVRGAEFTAIIE